MENKNDVPAGHDPAAGEAERPLSSTPDSEVPEFLKGPDPDELDDSGDAPTATERNPREAASGPDGPGPDASGQAASGQAAPGREGMDRDAWEAEFSSADATEPTDAPSKPTDGQHAATDATGFDDGRSASNAEAPDDREDPTLDTAGQTTETTANATVDGTPGHTRTLPTWDQDTAAGPGGVDGEATSDVPSDVRSTGGAKPDQEPDGATAAGTGAGVGAGAAAGAGAATADSTPATTADPATTDPVGAGAEPADPDAAQRTDAVLAAKRRGGAPRQPGEDSDPEAQRRQKARDAALTAKPRLARVVQTVLAIFFPFLLLIGAIRAVASPWFLWLDYHRPGFPADVYGFGPAERLTYGNYGVDYINNSAPSSYLGNLVDGKGDPLFLGTEVSHMADVKAVIGITYAAGIVMAILAVIICLYLSRRYAGGIRRAFFAGSVITLVAMIALTVLAVLNFETFFTDFHELFFAQGNWTFHANDTLIRLYPTQFWMDAGIVIAGLVLLVSLVFLITNWPTRKRRERSRLRQSNRDLGLD